MKTPIIKNGKPMLWGVAAAPGRMDHTVVL